MKDEANWAALVTIVNMDKKNFEKVKKHLEDRAALGEQSLKIPDCDVCDRISKEREKKDRNKQAISSVKVSQKKSLSLQRRPQVPPTAGYR